MADFCKQCSEHLFGEDFGDFEGVCEEGQRIWVICEGCGSAFVDHTGRCHSFKCDAVHGKEKGE